MKGWTEFAEPALRLSRAAVSRILGRRQAYRNCFCGKGGRTPDADGEEVLADIVRFGYVRKPAPTNDPITIARIEGRREMALRILEHVHIDDDALMNLKESTDG